MNERIRELADQILPNEREFNKGDPKDWGYFFSGEELEKFAELIIQECLDVMSKTSKEANERFTYMGDDVPTVVHQMKIKKHFGVQE